MTDPGPTPGTAAIAPKLRIRTMVAYGVGQLAEGVKSRGFEIFLLFYYNQVLGLSASWTAAALGFALVFDAVTDPIVGAWSDRTRSRWGRRHPFLLAAALPLAGCFVLLFNPPAGLSDVAALLWLLTFSVLTRAAMTLFYVPHLALGAELASDYEQRSSLYILNMAFGGLGLAVFVPLSYLWFFPTTEQFDPGLLNQDAYWTWSLFGAAVMIGAIVLCCLGTASEVPRLRALANVAAPTRLAPKKVLSELREAFHNKSFRAIFFGMLLSTFVLTVETVLNAYMAFHFWELTTEQISVIPLGIVIGLIAAIALIPRITRRFDKKPTLMGAALLAVINVNGPIVMVLLDVSFFPAPGSTGMLVALTINAGVTGFLAPIIFATLNSMFADIADEHELEVGERREGIIFSARAFAQKATSSMGLVVGGVLLDLINFPEEAAVGDVPPAVVWQLGLLVGPATSVFTVVGLLLYMGYRLDRQRHADIMLQLSQRRGQGASDQNQQGSQITAAVDE